MDNFVLVSRVKHSSRSRAFVLAQAKNIPIHSIRDWGNEMDKYQNQLKGMTTLATFTFTYNGKTYGPFTGLGVMFLKKSLEFANRLNGFWGLGNESYYDEKSQAGHLDNFFVW